MPDGAGVFPFYNAPRSDVPAQYFSEQRIRRSVQSRGKATVFINGLCSLLSRVRAAFPVFF